MISILFLGLTVGVFGYFGYAVFKTSQQLQRVGSGSGIYRSYLGNLDQIPKRILSVFNEGILQTKMFKDPTAGFMHFLIFWGFITVSVGTLETLLHGIFSGLDAKSLLGDGQLFRVFVVSQDWGNAMVLLAVSFALFRRLLFAPKRLKGLKAESKYDALVVLLFIAGLVKSELLYMGARASLGVGEPGSLAGAPLWWATHYYVGIYQKVFPFMVFAPEVMTQMFFWLHVTFLFSFMVFLPHSKHQHLIWAFPNIFFKNLKPSGYIPPMVFQESAETFGVGKAKDFSWKTLLDGITCVECGRCSSVCPAYTTGKKLDPRLMIHHLKTAFASERNPKSGASPLLSLIGMDGIVSEEELWGCTTCGACMNACPLSIEHIPAIVDMRRYLTMTEGKAPPELQTTLANLEQHNNPWGINNDSRADWAQGLAVTTMAEKSDVEYLFWVGCAGSFDDKYKKVSKSIVKIMQEAKISFSILGKEEKCNGDTARRAGQEYLAQEQMKVNIETLKGYKIKKIVTGCPHCFNTIKNEYPDFGYEAEVIHHSQLIADLLRDKKITMKETGETTPPVSTTTYHDSCYLGRHNNVYEEPRTVIAQAINATIKEMPRNKDNGFCCGAGGARMWMEEREGEHINVNRAQEAVDTGAKTIATACPFCMTMMRDGVASLKQNIEVKDISEFIADKLDRLQ